MKTIRQLLDAKGHDVWSTGPDDTVYDALALAYIVLMPASARERAERIEEPPQ